MAIDYWRTLDPRVGVARAVTVLPPAGPAQPLWTVAADIGQSDWGASRLRAEDYPLDLVGACGVDRPDAFVRAAGEAVERASLLPHASLPDRCGHGGISGDDGLAWCSVGIAPGTRETAWYAGTRLSDHGRVAIPASTIDYPWSDQDVLTRSDPSPSGAASGPDRADAARRALLEVIERDAAMVAWARQVAMVRVDLRPVAANDACGPSARRLGKLLRLADGLGVTITAGAVPTCVPGLPAVVAVADDPDLDLATAGAGVAADFVGSLVRAVQESLQVRSVVAGVRAHYPSDSVAAVTNDVERARWWALPGHADELRKWAASFVPGPLDVTGRAEDLETVAGALAAEGTDAAIVDLSCRLPDEARAMGWSAVRAIVPDYQSLRMNEQLAWTWQEARLEASGSRWPGLGAATAPGEVYPVPHPLI